MSRWVLVALLAAVACSEPEATPPVPASAPAPEAAVEPEAGEPKIPEKAAKAATIAREIRAQPDSAADVVGNHGMTPDEFSDLMYEIAGDPELAEAYETARG